MATIIDALVVTIGLDPAMFKQGSKEVDAAMGGVSKKSDETTANLRKNEKALSEDQKKAAQAQKQRAKEMEQWGKGAASAISKVRNEVLGLLAVFTAGVGIKSFVENTISSTASLGRMSKNLDMSAKDLAMWQLANKNAGGSVEGMTAQLQEAQKAVSDYKLGLANSANAGFWASTYAKNSDFKDAETLLRARADAVAKIIERHGVGIGRSKAAEMGISEETFNLLKQGSSEVDRQRLAQSRLADEQARLSGAAEAFRQKWDSVKNSLEAVGVKILTRLMPQLEHLADWLDQNQDHIQTWSDRVVKAIEKFVTWADKAADSVGGWKNVLIGLIALNILSAVAPLVSLGAALVGIGGGLGLIGTLGGAALAVLGGLAAAKALGLPDTDRNKGIDAVKNGDWWKASTLLPAADFLRASKDRLMGKSNEEIARALAAASDQPKATDAPASAKPAGAKMTPSDFAAKYGAAAAKAGAALGVDSRTILGQWGLETGWGKSVIPGTNNLGNIKDFSGSGVAAKDNMTGSVDKYRAYASADAFADDYVSLVKRKYPKAVGASSAEDFARALKSGGYAEDPDYVRKLASASRMAGLRGAAGAANSIEVAGASRQRTMAGNVTNTSTNETNINGPINIVTQATDADGIAKGIGSSLQRYGFASQTNMGLA